MDKDILQQYIDACELIEETEKEIEKLQNKKEQIVQDTVRGSDYEFPYTAKTFHMSGIVYSAIKDSEKVKRQEQILIKRKAKAEEVKQKTEEWLNETPIRMQRIIKYKFFQGMTWAQVATKIGRDATPDSVRAEFKRFIKNS